MPLWNPRGCGLARGNQRLDASVEHVGRVEEGQGGVLMVMVLPV